MTLLGGLYYTDMGLCEGGGWAPDKASFCCTQFNNQSHNSPLFSYKSIQNATSTYRRDLSVFLLR